MLPKPDIAGIVWYTRETYDLCLGIFADAADLPATFDEWLVKIKRTEKKLRQLRVRFIRVELDPDTFAAWCTANGYSEINADARSHYASLIAAERAR